MLIIMELFMTIWLLATVVLCTIAQTVFNICEHRVATVTGNGWIRTDPALDTTGSHVCLCSLQALQQSHIDIFFDNITLAQTTNHCDETITITAKSNKSARHDSVLFVRCSHKHTEVMTSGPLPTGEHHVEVVYTWNSNAHPHRRGTIAFKFTSVNGPLILECQHPRKWYQSTTHSSTPTPIRQTTQHPRRGITDHITSTQRRRPTASPVKQPAGLPTPVLAAAVVTPLVVLAAALAVVLVVCWNRRKRPPEASSSTAAWSNNVYGVFGEDIQRTNEGYVQQVNGHDAQSQEQATTHAEDETKVDLSLNTGGLVNTPNGIQQTQCNPREEHCIQHI